jgi:hypothetical protein
MKIVLTRKKVLFGVAIALSATGFASAASADHGEGLTGTYDYDCHHYPSANQHDVTSGGNEFSDGAHGMYSLGCMAHPAAP